MYYSINENDKQVAISNAILMREQELMGYDLNISNYTAMLESLPQDDWPDNLKQYQQASADQVPDDVHEDVAKYQFRDHMRTLLKTEKAEREKSNLIYQTLIAQLPADKIDQIMADAITRLKTPK